MADLPVESASVDAAGGVVTVVISDGHGGRDIIYGAAHSLIDRAWVRLDSTPEGALVVQLELRDKADDAATNQERLETLANQLVTGALWHQWRRQMVARHGVRVQRILFDGLGVAPTRHPQAVLPTQPHPEPPADAEERA